MRSRAPLEFLHIYTPRGGTFISHMILHIYWLEANKYQNSNCSNVQSASLSKCVTAKWTQQETEMRHGTSRLKSLQGVSNS